MKNLARTLNHLFHPMLMPVLGLLLILNSGTYLALLDPGAKRVLLMVMGMGTLLFPLFSLPFLHYRRTMAPVQDRMSERMLPMLVILVLYGITMVYFMRLPLSRLLHAYALSFTLLTLLIFLSEMRFRLCTHMAGLGGMAALVLALMLLYEVPLQGILMLVLLAAGISGSVRLYLGMQNPAEEAGGFLLGFLVIGATLLLY